MLHYSFCGKILHHHLLLLTRQFPTDPHIKQLSISFCNMNPLNDSTFWYISLILRPSRFDNFKREKTTKHLIQLFPIYSMSLMWSQTLLFWFVSLISSRPIAAKLLDTNLMSSDKLPTKVNEISYSNNNWSWCSWAWLGLLASSSSLYKENN